MKHCSLLCVRWWPLVFIGLPILFMLPLLAFKWRYIEANVAHNTATNLQAAKLNWANIETRNRGRNILITGSPPSQAAIDMASTIAKSSYGVNKVTLTTDVKAPPQYAKLSATLSNKKLQLSGVLSSQSEMDTIVSYALSVVSAADISNQLTIASNTRPLPDSRGLFSVLKNSINGNNELTLRIKQNILTIEGDVTSKLTKHALGENLNQQYQGQVVNAINIIAPPHFEPEKCRDLLNQLLIKNPINFESAKAIITTDSFVLLNSIKATVERCPDVHFEIAGHTDSSGKLAFNMSLSQARAKAVLDHLVGLGLNDTQFIATGYGPNQPMTDNSSAQSRAQNRRIEFNLKN